MRIRFPLPSSRAASEVQARQVAFSRAKVTATYVFSQLVQAEIAEQSTASG